MLTLIKFTRDGAFALWDEHFKSVLLILLETLGDDDVSITQFIGGGTGGIYRSF